MLDVEGGGQAFRRALAGLTREVIQCLAAAQDGTKSNHASKVQPVASHASAFHQLVEFMRHHGCAEQGRDEIEPGHHGQQRNERATDEKPQSMLSP